MPPNELSTRETPAVIARMLLPYAAACVALALLFGFGFLYRRDYASHAVAGAATVFAVAAVIGTRVDDDRAAMGAGLAVAALAVVSEPILFGPTFDAIDVANSIAGAAVGVAVLSRYPVASRARVPLVVSSVCVVIAALIVRHVSSIGPALL